MLDRENISLDKKFLRITAPNFCNFDIRPLFTIASLFFVLMSSILLTVLILLLLFMCSLLPILFRWEYENDPCSEAIHSEQTSLQSGSEQIVSSH